jgi:hypothetical protein
VWSRRDGGAPSRAFATRFAGALFDNDTESDRLLVGARVMLTSASYAAAVGSDAALAPCAAFTPRAASAWWCSRWTARTCCAYAVAGDRI